MSSSNPRISSLSPLSTGLPLHELVTQLGPATMKVIVGSRQSSALNGVVYYDTEITPQQVSGRLIIVTSHDALGPDRLDRMCRSFRDAGATGVVAKAVSTLGGTQLTQACESHGLSLLELAPEVEWREFDALVSRLLGEHGAGLQLGANSGDKLFALANSIAHAFRGSVAIEDHRRNILAYSVLPGQAIDNFRATGILTRRAPEGPLNETRYRQVFATDGVSRFPTNNEYAPRAAVPVRAGNMPLGSIWVIDPDGDDVSVPLAAEKQKVLEGAAALAAGYIVDAWRFEHGDERSKEAALRRMLSGNTHENDSTVLGLRHDHSYLVMAIDGGAIPEGELGELRTATSRHFSVYFPGSICTVVDGAVLALLPTNSTDSVKRSLDWFLRELSRLTDHRCHVGLSDPRKPSASFAPDRERAVQVAQCARLVGLDVAVPSEVKAQLILQECGDAIVASDLALPEAAELLSSAESETRETLLTWFEEQGKAPRVAERLNLHEQTVRYRVRKAYERFGLADMNADQLLVLWLQLRIASMKSRLAESD